MIRCDKGHGYSNVIHDECPACLRGEPKFIGSDYDDSHDHVRLSGQIKRVRDLMSDHAWRTLDEIAINTGDPQASVSAQLRHLRKPRFGGNTVDKRPRGNRSNGLFEYRVGAA